MAGSDRSYGDRGAGLEPPSAVVRTIDDRSATGNLCRLGESVSDGDNPSDRLCLVLGNLVIGKAAIDRAVFQSDLPRVQLLFRGVAGVKALVERTRPPSSTTIAPRVTAGGRHRRLSGHARF